MTFILLSVILLRFILVSTIPKNVVFDWGVILLGDILLSGILLTFFSTENHYIVCPSAQCVISRHPNNDISMQLGFSSNVTSDTVTLTNFIKSFNFCGGLYFDSLVAKSLSNHYCNSSSNFQSNDWQKVQYNTDLFEQKRMYLHRNESLN